MTVLTIILVALIAANVWLMYHTCKRERQRRRQLQERMDEFDENIGQVCGELSKAKQRVREAQSANSALKKSFEETIKEYEKLTRDYRKLQDDFDAYKKANPHAEPQDPVGHGEPSVHDEPGEPANKPLKPLKAKRGRKPKKA